MELLPDALPASLALALVFASFLTSALTASLGLGGGVVLLGLLAYALPVSVLIPLHGVIQSGSNASRVTLLHRHVAWPRIVPFLAGTLVGVAVGAAVFIRLPEAVLTTALGIFILLIVWVEIPALQHAGRLLFAAGGAISGFLTMFVGATGPLTAVFLAKTFADRRSYSASHAAVMLFQHGSKILLFAILGFSYMPWLTWLAAMIAAGYLGTVVGTRILLRVPESRFRLWFRLAVTLLAIDLLRRGIVNG